MYVDKSSGISGQSTTRIEKTGDFSANVIDASMREVYNVLYHHAGWQYDEGGKI